MIVNVTYSFVTRSVLFSFGGVLGFGSIIWNSPTSSQLFSDFTQSVFGMLFLNVSTKIMTEPKPSVNN